jgi:murein DD-endopeptidase MepM/ murein hydrolase activator NlpD
MKKIFFISIMVVCLISNKARSEIRICEHFETAASSSCDCTYIEDMLYSSLSFGATKSSKILFMFPADGRVSSYFGSRIDPFYGGISFHRGIDIARQSGGAVRAAERGRIAYAGWMGGCGMAAEVDHGRGLTTRYCHLGRLTVGKGDRVLAGQTIGSIGSSGRATGSHLHFEVRRYGSAVDPAEYLVF